MKNFALALIALLSLSAMSAKAWHRNEPLAPVWLCGLGETHLKGISGGFILGGALYYSDEAELSCVSSLGQVVDHIPVTVSISEFGWRTGGSLTLDLLMASANLGIESIDHIYQEFTLGASTGGTLILGGARASAGFSVSNSSRYAGVAGKVDFSAGPVLGLEWNALSGSVMKIQSR